jgi:uncharacterized protein (DUF1330 family)
LQRRGRKVAGGGEKWFQTTRDEILAIWRFIDATNKVTEYSTPPFFRESGESTVNRHITVGLAMVASAVLGAAAVQTLHAQTKPPAYNIAEITIKDQDGYNKEYLPLITKALTDAGGKFLVRGGKTISYEGAAPAPRVVVVQFESLDKLQALYNSASYKEAIAVGDKYATQRIFGVEGASP